MCYTVPYLSFHDKIKPDKPQITTKKAKETVKNQEIPQSFDKKFLFSPESFVFAPSEIKQTLPETWAQLQ